MERGEPEGERARLEPLLVGCGKTCGNAEAPCSERRGWHRPRIQRLCDTYGAFIRRDPFRIGLHYPAVLAALGNRKMRILDVGCNEGLFPRLLAARGAS